MSVPAFLDSWAENVPKTNESTSTWRNVIIAHTNKVHMNRNGQLNMSGTLQRQAGVSWPCNTTLKLCGTPENKPACFVTQEFINQRILTLLLFTMVRVAILCKMGVIVYLILVFNTQMKTCMGEGGEERRGEKPLLLENSPHSGIVILQVTV